MPTKPNYKYWLNLPYYLWYRVVVANGHHPAYFQEYLATPIQHRSLQKWGAFTRGAERQRKLSLSVHLVSVWGGGAAPPWRFCRSAHEQTRLLAAGDSCCQMVPQRFSGSIQGVPQAAVPEEVGGNRKYFYSPIRKWVLVKILYVNRRRALRLCSLTVFCCR